MRDDSTTSRKVYLACAYFIISLATDTGDYCHTFILEKYRPGIAKTVRMTFVAFDFLTARIKLVIARFRLLSSPQ